ncbi:hypothetical protein BV25DRAFT_1771244, partial [Artomyces pyxidatus]
SNIGGLFEAILAMSGGFGKFLTVIVALTMPSGVAPTMYSCATSFMAIAPGLEPCISLLPVAIIGAARFHHVLVDIVSISGYWCSSFAAIVMTDHAIIRRERWESYVLDDWNTSRRLPLGTAAVGPFSCSIDIVVPCTSQVWYTGPIAARETGNI